MKTKDLAQLVTVADARFQHERRKIADLIAEEQRIRHAINTVQASGRMTGQDTHRALQLAGADMAWRVWSGQRLSTLNMELAQVLARKEHEMAQVRRAFGQKEALRMLKDKTS